MLKLAVRTFCALTESAREAKPATLWSWDATREVLLASPKGTAVVEALSALTRPDRARALRYVGAFEPLSVVGEAFVFTDVAQARAFVAETESAGGVVTLLDDYVVSAAMDEPRALAAAVAKYAGAPYKGPSITDAYDRVDVTLPLDMLTAGLPLYLVEKVLLAAIDGGGLDESRVLGISTDGPEAQFRGRLARFAQPKAMANERKILGVAAPMIEAMLSRGMIPAHAIRQVRLAVGEASADVGQPPSSANPPSSPPPDRGGVAKDQPDARSGSPAQSKSEPATEPKAPTERVPDGEEGGDNGDIKLPDGTIVPADVLKAALAKLMANLATQLEQGTEGGKPKDKAEPDPEAEKPEDKAAQEAPPAAAPAAPAAGNEPAQNANPAANAAAAPKPHQPAAESRQGVLAEGNVVDAQAHAQAWLRNASTFLLHAGLLVRRDGKNSPNWHGTPKLATQLDELARRAINLSVEVGRMDIPGGYEGTVTLIGHPNMPRGTDQASDVLTAASSHAREAASALRQAAFAVERTEGKEEGQTVFTMVGRIQSLSDRIGTYVDNFLSYYFAAPSSSWPASYGKGESRQVSAVKESQRPAARAVAALKAGGNVKDIARAMIEGKPLPEATVDEGVHDPHIFKAIFLAGGGGSGKGFVGGMLFGTMDDQATTAFGLKSTNSDDIVRALSKGLGGAPKFSLKTELGGDIGQAARAHAKTLIDIRKASWVAGRLGLILDGTGKDVAEVLQQKHELEALGYDTYMIFVDTTIEVALARNKTRDRVVPEPVLIKAHQQVQQNKHTFASAFGSHYYAIDNSKMSSEQEIVHELMPKFSRLALKILNEPIKNPRGQEWVRQEIEGFPPDVQAALFGKVYGHNPAAYWLQHDPLGAPRPTPQGKSGTQTSFAAYAAKHEAVAEATTFLVAPDARKYIPTSNQDRYLKAEPLTEETEPKAYLSPQPSGKVQVISGGSSVFQGTDADALAFMRKHYGAITPMRFVDGEFVPVAEADAPAGEYRPGAIGAASPTPQETSRYPGNRPSEAYDPMQGAKDRALALIATEGPHGASMSMIQDLGKMGQDKQRAFGLARMMGAFDSPEKAKSFITGFGPQRRDDDDYESMNEAALVPWRTGLGDGSFKARVDRLNGAGGDLEVSLDTLAGEMAAWRAGKVPATHIKMGWSDVVHHANIIKAAADGVAHHADANARTTRVDAVFSRQDEALDVGQDSEAEMASKGFADAAAVVKTLREASFMLCTDNLVRLESLTQAVDAKKANRLIAKLREMCAEFNDMVGEIADGLEEANDIFKGESGGKGGEDHGADANAADPAAAPAPPAAAPAAAATVAAPVAAPVSAPAPAAEGVVAKAVAKLVGGRVSERIREGEPYADVANAILAGCGDLGLTSGQVSEVHARLQVAERLAEPRAFKVKLAETDRATLSSVRGGAHDPVAALVSRTAGGAAVVVAEGDLDGAVHALRRFGGENQRELAGRLSKLMGA